MDELNQKAPMPTPQVPKKSGSKMILFIFGAVIVIIVLLISIRLYGLSQTQLVNDVFLQPSPTPIDETANWKTYISEKIGFEFKYPDGWNIESLIPNNNSSETSSLRVYNIEAEKEQRDFLNDCAKNQSLSKCATETYREGFTLSIYENEDNLDFETYFSKRIAPTLTVYDADGIIREARNIQIGSLKVKKGDRVGLPPETYSYFMNSQNSVVFVLTGNGPEIDQILSTFKFIEQPVLPTACKDEPEGTPVITSISPASGSVGTKVEIKGCNFSGFEGDKNAWIENSEGVKGILYGQEGSTSKLLKITLESPLCQVNNSYSGIPCDKFLTLTPGVYKIYTMPWGKKSNELSFTIK